MTSFGNARVGDLILIGGRRVGASRHVAEILEVLGAPEHEHYRVRWDDGRESIFTPGNDAVLEQVDHDGDEPVLVHEP